MKDRLRRAAAWTAAVLCAGIVAGIVLAFIQHEAVIVLRVPAGSVVYVGHLGGKPAS